MTNTPVVNNDCLNALSPSDKSGCLDQTPQVNSVFMKIFRNHAAIMLLFDAETGDIVDANQAAVRFYEWPVERLLSMNFSEIDKPSVPWPDGWLKMLTSEGNQSMFSRHRRGDNAFREVAMSLCACLSDGKYLIHCVVQDNSEQQYFRVLTGFRNQLIEMSDTTSTEELLTFTLDEAERLTGSTLGFFNFITDDRAVLRHACSSNAKLDNCGHAPHPTIINFGVSNDVIQNKRAVIHNDHATLRHCNCRSSPHKPSIRELIVPIIRNGKVMATLEIGNKPIDYDDNDVRLLSILTGVAWDIIAKKYAEASEQSMQEAMQYTQKMELIGQLAGGIAHDINNVLMVVLGHAEMVLDEMNVESPYNDSLTVIRDSSIRAANLIQQLLAFARKQIIQPVILRLDSALEQTLPMLREMIGSSIHLDWHPGASDAKVMLDPSQLDQIITNLCTNAGEAISGTGTVTIETSVERVTSSDCFAEHPFKTPGDFVKLSVIDSGHGIDKSILPHIFEPFFTTKEIGKGSGLGLSTVYGIVKQNRGCLDCKSEPGDNTCFTIYLPLFDESPDQCRNQPPKEPEQNPDLKTVLLVDNDPAIIHLVSTFLAQNGFRMLAAASPDEALSLLTQSGVMANLLLCDLLMPEMHGHELSERMRIYCPEMKTIFMSGSTVETIGHPEPADTSSLVIGKPFSIHELTRALRALLA